MTVDMTTIQPDFTYDAVKFKDALVENERFEKTVHIEYTDPDDGKVYSGALTFKRATIGMLAEIGVLTARYSEGLPLDNTTTYINTMRAYCAVIVTTKPAWLDFTALYDVALLRAVYHYAFAWEGSFRRKAVEQRRQ